MGSDQGPRRKSFPV